MKILAIYGNPKEGGFVHGCVDFIVDSVEKSGAEVTKLHLVNKNIQECTGCFACLRTGKCVIDDDMNSIYEDIKDAEGFVFGASVRDSSFPALVKKFYERITYPILFTREIADKHVLSIGAVGMASGKKELGSIITFCRDQAKLTDYLFFRTGIPTKIKVDDVTEKLLGASEKFVNEIQQKTKRPFISRLLGKIDDLVVKKFMLDKDKDGNFANVTKVWKEKGLLKR